jgi:hypothetical protein
VDAAGAFARVQFREGGFVTAQVDQDEEHLRLLAIFHYIVGGIGGLFSFLPLLYMLIGAAILRAPNAFIGRRGDLPPHFIGWLMIAVGGGVAFAGWIFAGMVIFAGHCLQKRLHYTFCLVVACFECLFAPFGTVLGVFTIIVMARPAVKALFAPPA